MKTWHGGKLAMLWATWAAFTLLLSAATAEGYESPRVKVLMRLIIPVLVLLIVLTWWWLSGKEERRQG